MAAARMQPVLRRAGLQFVMVAAAAGAGCTTNLRLDVSDNTRGSAGPAPAPASAIVAPPSQQYRSDVLPSNSRPVSRSYDLATSPPRPFEGMREAEPVRAYEPPPSERPVPIRPASEPEASPLAPTRGPVSLGWRASSAEPGKLDGNQVVVVKQGDTLYKISRRYNVPLSEIYHANSLLSPKLKAGQHLIIPDKG